MCKSRLITIILAALSLSPLADAKDQQNFRGVITGYAAHGVNVFNNHTLVDYTSEFPYAPGLNEIPALTEIGYFQPGADDAGTITDETDSNLPVATSSSLARFFGVVDFVDPSNFNQSLDLIGSNLMGYQSTTDRGLLVPFELAGPGDTYVAGGVNSRPTVGEWGEISGVARIRCDDDGGVVEISVRDAFPNQLYSLWDIGVLNPKTESEVVYSTPFGGLPNVMTTDENGCGYKKITTPFCPKRSCAEGEASCSAYISLFYHWDDQIYGGAAANTFGGLPLGVLGGNHIVWPMAGTAVNEPANEFKSRSLQCGNKKNGHYGRHHARFNKK
ncbi:MAG: hypothetical protein COA42_21490 [Alteromonadaceae bacterium]|nr:MAG: hypothetical protein COA42_21490 [Alteromonadaceae bacterium]